MSNAYEAWRQSKAEGPVPDGFADRLVARASGLKPVGRVPFMIAVAAGAAFLLRVASTFLVFVTS